MNRRACQRHLGQLRFSVACSKGKAEEFCGQAACHSVSADFHYGTLCTIMLQGRKTDGDRQTEVEEIRSKNRGEGGKTGRVRGRERMLKAAGDSLPGLKM